MSRNTDIYQKCDHIKRPEPDATIDDALKKEISENYRTIPTFEKTTFEHKYINYYSLKRNVYLKCRWHQYKQHIEERVFAPFHFPEPRDLHFYNHTIRFKPSVSIFRFPEHRMKLRPGPGVDMKGQLPIPYEMYMKRL